MVKAWMGITPPPRGQGYYPGEDGLQLPYESESNRQAIKKAVEQGITEWFKTATPEQIHELIFEPYEAFKKEDK